MFTDSLIFVQDLAGLNPSEAITTRRSSYAETTSHLALLAENEGLHKGLQELSELVAPYQGQKDIYRNE